MRIFLPRTLDNGRRCHEASCPMEPYDRAPSPRLVRRPSAVSASLLSTPALDLDLHLVLTRPLADVVTATTSVRVSFHEERIAVDLLVSSCQVASGAVASALAAAQALTLRRTPAACREFVRQAMAAATAFCPN
jgi:hypothetical protein